MTSDRIEWESSAIKEEEWARAKQALAPSEILSPDGSKLRRTDSGLDHSFIVVGGQILSMSEQGVYLGTGIEGKVKIAEDEFGGVYALKIIASFDRNITTEGEIATDLSMARGEGTRLSRSSKPSEGNIKHYIPYIYLGIPLVQHLKKHHYVKQNSMVTLYYKSSEDMLLLKKYFFDSTQDEETSRYTNCYIWQDNMLMYIPNNVWNARAFIMEDPALFSTRLHDIAGDNSDGVFSLCSENFDTLIASTSWLYHPKRLIKTEFIREDGHSASYLSKDQLYDLAIKISLALHELHSGKNSRTSLGYAHSDPHFNNITINASGDISFIDFGYASILDNDNVHTFFNSRTKKKRDHGKENDVIAIMTHLTPPDKGDHQSLAIINESMLAENKNLHDLFKFYQGKPSALDLCKKLTLIRLKLDWMTIYDQGFTESETEMLIKKLNRHSQEIQEAYQAIDDLKALPWAQDTLIMEKINSLDVVYKSCVVAYALSHKDELEASLHDFGVISRFLSTRPEQITMIEPIMKRLNENVLFFQDDAQIERGHARK